MKKIPLSRGLFATVDDADYDWLNQWKWTASRQGRKNCEHPKWRAVRVVTENGRQRIILMHRQIMCPDDGQVIDHEDGNPLNNTRKNLIPCTQLQNCQNRNPTSGSVRADARVNSSVQKGVTWNRRQGKWVVQIERRHVGIFLYEQDAIQAAKSALGG